MKNGTTRLSSALAGWATPRRTLGSRRQRVLIWFQIRRPELFTLERFPVFNVLVPERRFYGFPEFGVPGFKFGKTTMWSSRLIQRPWTG